MIDENLERLEKEQPENVLPVSNGEIQYQPEDIGGINCDEIVAKLGYVGM